ncbi:LOW QUALITY PROTEIN: uncharacterized protein VSU04_005527 [Chlamydotis macqueenii]
MAGQGQGRREGGDHQPIVKVPAQLLRPTDLPRRLRGSLPRPIRAASRSISTGPSAAEEREGWWVCPGKILGNPAQTSAPARAAERGEGQNASHLASSLGSRGTRQAAPSPSSAGKRGPPPCRDTTALGEDGKEVALSTGWTPHPVVRAGRVDESPRGAGERVAWGRFFNAGQTRTAPDYVLRGAEMQEKLLPALREAIAEFYGPNPWESPDFGGIVGNKQFQRVQALLRSGRVAIGGQTDAEERYIGEGAGRGSRWAQSVTPSRARLFPAAPTVLVAVQQDDPVTQEEIFGPILPVSGVDDAVAFINARERPPALCVFSSRKKVRSCAGSRAREQRAPLSPATRVLGYPGQLGGGRQGVLSSHPPPQGVNRALERTSSGGFCANDAVVHMTLASPPFVRPSPGTGVQLPPGAPPSPSPPAAAPSRPGAGFPAPLLNLQGPVLTPSGLCRGSELGASAVPALDSPAGLRGR